MDASPLSLSLVIPTPNDLLSLFWALPTFLGAIIIYIIIILYSCSSHFLVKLRSVCHGPEAQWAVGSRNKAWDLRVECQTPVPQRLPLLTCTESLSHLPTHWPLGFCFTELTAQFTLQGDCSWQD